MSGPDPAFQAQTDVSDRAGVQELPGSPEHQQQRSFSANIEIRGEQGTTCFILCLLIFQ